MRAMVAMAWLVGASAAVASPVGLASLAANIAVEVEAVVELKR